MKEVGKLTEKELCELFIQGVEYYLEIYKVPYKKTNKAEKNIELTITTHRGKGQTILKVQKPKTNTILNIENAQEGIEAVDKSTGGIELYYRYKGIEIKILDSQINLWTKSVQTEFRLEKGYKGIRVCPTFNMNIYYYSDINALIYMILCFYSEVYEGYGTRLENILEECTTSNQYKERIKQEKGLNTLYGVLTYTLINKAS